MRCWRWIRRTSLLFRRSEADYASVARKGLSQCHTHCELNHLDLSVDNSSSYLVSMIPIQKQRSVEEPLNWPPPLGYSRIPAGAQVLRAGREISCGVKTTLA